MGGLNSLREVGVKLEDLRKRKGRQSIQRRGCDGRFGTSSKSKRIKDCQVYGKEVCIMDHNDNGLGENHREGLQKVLGNDLCGGVDSGVPKVVATMYPSLTKLFLSKLPKLEEWVETVIGTGSNGQSLFPKLESLEIEYCPRLRKIPNSCFPSLKVLKIEELESNMILETMSRNPSSLTSLELMSINDGGGEDSSSNMESIIKNSLSLTLLDLNDCKEQVFAQIQSSTLEYLDLGPFSDELDEFPWPFNSSYVTSFPNLIELHLYGWNKLMSILLFEQLQCSTFPAMTLLDITDFEGLKALPDSIAKLPSLISLLIWDCKNLESLPTFEESHSLEKLFINGCPILKERCSEGGPEWFKIQYIPQINLCVCIKLLCVFVIEPNSGVTWLAL
ncbi:hypothetical protein POM88_036145 [Heracleum sosnowskyi]|uniref:Uncharacterized protein n=1 Tax=Heracleum sosnowskyi TaxID=360622 RepID=A0AAD8MFC5_9APIA|nr:hypothetical protein POM88_036145 [Heracleum sosnowskyi]